MEPGANAKKAITSHVRRVLCLVGPVTLFKCRDMAVRFAECIIVRVAVLPLKLSQEQ